MKKDIVIYDLRVLAKSKYTTKFVMFSFRNNANARLSQKPTTLFIHDLCSIKSHAAYRVYHISPGLYVD